jgi:hypothetical protein
MRRGCPRADLRWPAGADFAGYLAVDAVILSCEGFATDPAALSAGSARILGGGKLRDGLARERRLELWLALVEFWYGKTENSMTMLRKSRRVSANARWGTDIHSLPTMKLCLDTKYPTLDAVKLCQGWSARHLAE